MLCKERPAKPNGANAEEKCTDDLQKMAGAGPGGEWPGSEAALNEQLSRLFPNEW